MSYIWQLYSQCECVCTLYSDQWMKRCQEWNKKRFQIRHVEFKNHNTRSSRAAFELNRMTRVVRLDKLQLDLNMKRNKGEQDVLTENICFGFNVETLCRVAKVHEMKPPFTIPYDLNKYVFRIVVFNSTLRPFGTVLPDSPTKQLTRCKAANDGTSFRPRDSMSSYKPGQRQHAAWW